MNRRSKISFAFVVATAMVILLWLRADSREEKMANATRVLLRQHGLKTDLSQFDFFTSPEFRARMAALTNRPALRIARDREKSGRRSALQQAIPDLMKRIGPNSAMVLWNRERLPLEDGAISYLELAEASGGGFWPALRELMEDDRERLDAACSAALSGPIRFHLDANRGFNMLLPHLSVVKELCQTLGARTILELHDGRRDEAWTNLLAATRLVTAWTPEPTEVSMLVRLACATIAFDTLWQALQADGWSDERLLNLQREWQSVDFFSALPETMAFARASAIAACQRARGDSPGLLARLKYALRSPQTGWSILQDYRRQLEYRQHGSYEDERDLLLYYRDREVELKGALRAKSWLEMRQMPGATNTALFLSKHHSGIGSLLNLRQMQRQMQMRGPTGEAGSILGRAAEAEARRRIALAAIALQRYRSRFGSYPDNLEKLTPAFLKAPPIDFMDGRPLRYRLSGEDRFVLYSTGLDCHDNGGTMTQRAQRARFALAQASVPHLESDLVWPEPSAGGEMDAFDREQITARAERINQQEEQQSAWYWRRTAQRQAKVEKILLSNPIIPRREPMLQGRPLSELLRSGDWSLTNRVSLDDLLTLREIRTGNEPEKITFETSIRYDILTNLGTLELLVDPTDDFDSDEGCAAGMCESVRGSKGKCRLEWQTIYESPGKHAIQLALSLNRSTRIAPTDSMPADGVILGPLTPIVVSNLCQFSLSSAYVNPELGGTLRAKLAESNGVYKVEIKSPTGEHLRTFSGSTSNGLITVHRDLRDDAGRRCTNSVFETRFHITLPNSGRSQTLEGP